MGELWDVYTKDRRLTGKTCIRGEQGNLLEDEFHMWVMVWIKNPKTGKYLVSQRSADKDTDPLKWETVAGHAVSGDTSLDAAQREVFEVTVEDIFEFTDSTDVSEKGKILRAVKLI